MSKNNIIIFSIIGILAISLGAGVIWGIIQSRNPNMSNTSSEVISDIDNDIKALDELDPKNDMKDESIPFDEEGSTGDSGTDTSVGSKEIQDLLGDIDGLNQDPNRDFAQENDINFD